MFENYKTNPYIIKTLNKLYNNGDYKATKAEFYKEFKA